MPSAERRARTLTPPDSPRLNDASGYSRRSHEDPINVGSTVGLCAAMKGIMRQSAGRPMRIHPLRMLWVISGNSGDSGKPCAQSGGENKNVQPSKSSFIGRLVLKSQCSERLNRFAARPSYGLESRPSADEKTAWPSRSSRSDYKSRAIFRRERFITSVLAKPSPTAKSQPWPDRLPPAPSCADWSDPNAIMRSNAMGSVLRFPRGRGLRHPRNRQPHPFGDADGCELAAAQGRHRRDGDGRLRGQFSHLLHGRRHRTPQVSLCAPTFQWSFVTAALEK
jgi:hypothetical protein